MQTRRASGQRAQIWSSVPAQAISMSSQCAPSRSTQRGAATDRELKHARRHQIPYPIEFVCRNPRLAGRVNKPRILNMPSAARMVRGEIAQSRRTQLTRGKVPLSSFFCVATIYVVQCSIAVEIAGPAGRCGGNQLLVSRCDQFASDPACKLSTFKAWDHGRNRLLPTSASLVIASLAPTGSRTGDATRSLRSWGATAR